MEKEPAAARKGFVQWAITPPQSYAVYLVCLFLVAGLSFYVGTLKPKKAINIGPPPMSTPRNWVLIVMPRETPPSIRRINPPELGTPPGYSQIVDVSAGRIIFIAGQTALDRDG